MLNAFLSLYLTFTNPAPVTQLPPKIVLPSSYAWNESSLLEVSPPPKKTEDKIAPIIGAKSAIAIDPNSLSILYEKNIHQKMQIASITKIMTAIIILEENDLNEVVTVSSQAAQTGGSKIWLRPGEKITVENMLYGLLIASGNDVAYALAEHNAGSVEAFVKKMNAKAKLLKLNNTHFDNPIGFDSDENYSTAYDLAFLGIYAYKKDFIKNIVKNSHYTISSVNGKHNYNLEATNKLLGGYLNVQGFKTGSTVKAGLCLMSIADKDNKQVLSIVLNSPARFKESKILLDWAYRAYIW